jgi:hypothetical protein
MPGIQNHNLSWLRTFQAHDDQGARLRQFKAVIEDCPGSLLVEYKKISG